MYSYNLHQKYVWRVCGCLNPYSGGKCIPIRWDQDETNLLVSLNPYSGGKCIPIYKEIKPREKLFKCLNPYSGGKCIPIGLQNSAKTTKKESLNPYSGGKCIPIVWIVYVH